MLICTHLGPLDIHDIYNKNINITKIECIGIFLIIHTHFFFGIHIFTESYYFLYRGYTIYYIIMSFLYLIFSYNMYTFFSPVDPYTDCLFAPNARL